MKKAQKHDSNKRKPGADKCKEQADFYRVMKWFLPIFLTVALAFYVYKIKNQDRPTIWLEAKYDSLYEDNSKSEAKITDLQERVLKLELEKEARHRETPVIILPKTPPDPNNSPKN